MNSAKSLRRSRFLQFAGIVIALLGLVGFWLSRGVERTEIDPGTAEVLGIDEPGELDTKPITFVIAGRDRAITQFAGAEILDENGRVIGREYEAKLNEFGTNTDTIIYASIIGNKINLINIPRDIWLDEWLTKVNAIYSYQEGEGLKNSVSNILDLPIDYYAIINLSIFEKLVDDLGGVEVYVPYRMYYNDYAGQLFIDLQEGLQTLNGSDAAGFVRLRNTGRGDYDRIDRVKTLAFAMLQRLKELNVSAAIKLPALATTVFEEVETNADLALILDLLPRINSLEIGNALTIPTEIGRATSYEGLDISVLRYDSQEVSEFLANTYGGKAREFTKAPEVNLLITNRSGVASLGDVYKAQLTAMGVSEESIFVRDAPNDPTPSRLLAVQHNWSEADYFISLFQTGKQQIDHLPDIQGEKMHLEFILGEDAANTIIAQQTLDSLQSAVNTD